MKNYKTLNLLKSIVILINITLIISCSKDDSIGEDQASGDISIIEVNTSATSEGDTNNAAEDEDDLVNNASFDYTIEIDFTETSATITNPVEGNGVDITLIEGDVIVESTISNVAYQVSGTTTDGSLKIYSDKKFKLTLNNANITNSDGPAINIQSSKTAFIIAEGTNNLSDALSYDIPDTEDAKAAFFSEGQLVFSGIGSISVAGKYKHGIASDDYIRVIEGTINVTESVKDAIHTNDYVVIDGGNLNLAANSDGIDCEEGYIVINDGTFNLNVLDDGIVASYDVEDETEPDASITPYVTINGGVFNIISSEGEGIESKSILTINDGIFDIDAFDDGINAIEALYINGGKLYVYSQTNDAVDANGNVTITGGTVIAIGATGHECGFDLDNHTFKITGGTVLGLSGSTSTPTANVCTQNSVIFGSVSKNSILHIQSSDGIEALTFLVPRTVETVLYSSSKIATDETYNIYSGGTVSDGLDFKGLYTDGLYSGGLSTGLSFTPSGKVTNVNR